MAMSVVQNSLSQTPQTLTPQIPHCYRFRPYDQELVRFYLYIKITNPDLFTTINVPVRDFHLFGDHAIEPWQIWDSFPKRDGEDLYFFTQLIKKGKKFVRKIGRGPGTWHQEYKHPPFNVSINHNCEVAAIKKLFTYQNPKSDKNGSWFIVEYSLPLLSEQTVLCRLKKKEVHSTETVQTTTITATATRKRKMDACGVDDATNIIFQKPCRVEEDAQKQQIMSFNGAAKTLSQVENQQLPLELQPVFENGEQFDDFESFYFEPPTALENDVMASDSYITSTGNATLPTEFVLNPTENLQSSDNDGDAAATEDGDCHREICAYLYSNGWYDVEEDDVPETRKTAEASAYRIQATPTLDESSTADAVDCYLERGVSDSSLTNWSGSFTQTLPEANPTSLVQENEIEMIPPHMERHR